MQDFVFGQLTANGAKTVRTANVPTASRGRHVRKRIFDDVLESVLRRHSIINRCVVTEQLQKYVCIKQKILESKKSIRKIYRYFGYIIDSFSIYNYNK